MYIGNVSSIEFNFLKYDKPKIMILFIMDFIRLLTEKSILFTF
jgi:hypothetical protein